MGGDEIEGHLPHPTLPPACRGGTSHRDAEPQDVVLVALRDHGVQHGAVVGLAVGDHHHDLGGARPSAGSCCVSEVSVADQMKGSLQRGRPNGALSSDWRPR